MGSTYGQACQSCSNSAGLNLTSRRMLRSVPIFRTSFPCIGTVVRTPTPSMKWCDPRMRSTAKPRCCRKRTISRPVGRGSLATTELGEIPVEFADDGRTDACQRVFQPEGVDVADERFL